MSGGNKKTGLQLNKGTCLFNYLLCFPLLLFIGYTSYSQTGKNQWLNTLKKEVSLSSQYDNKKLSKIDSLRQLPLPLNEGDLFSRYLQLYNEYSLFNFDSAYFYARKMQATATLSADAILINYARIKLSLILLSSGMFKEVFDTLKNIILQELDSSALEEYYILKARCYFDLADYSQGKLFTNYYNSEALKFLDSSLLIFKEHSFQYHYFNGLKDTRAGNVRMASAHFFKLISMPDLSLHQQAIVNSTFSDIYIRKMNFDSAIILLSEAAIEDIQSSTKETSAIFNLANLLFKQGDVQNASAFIQKAASDAKTYGARQRMVQLSSVLPLIEAEKLLVVEKQKKSLGTYAIIITLSFLFLIGLSLVIVRQVRKLKTQQKEINRKNVSLHHLVEEKEWLLKEIHHRVKNNLHTITSLLESQASFLQNDALAAIRDSQHRVYAMSLIHQKLYQPEKNVTDINIPVYVQELVNYLKESFETGQRIKFQMELEPIALDISLAVPLGLILNEAITNSVKYAFPGQREGVISITIKKFEKDTLQFSVADDGIGLPEGLEISKTRSLGLKLIKGLSEDIIAKFGMENKDGTRIVIEFAIKKSLRHLQNIADSGKN